MGETVIKSLFDYGRVVRNFMNNKELEVYKKFLPENRMARSRYLQDNVLGYLSHHNGLTLRAIQNKFPMNSPESVTEVLENLINGDYVYIDTNNYNQLTYSVTPEGREIARDLDF